MVDYLFLCVSQKYEKPKFVTCIGFSENGDVISGDSNGSIMIWGRGECVYISFVRNRSIQCIKLTIPYSFNRIPLFILRNAHEVS